jgi:hypothetical protein
MDKKKNTARKILHSIISLLAVSKTKVIIKELSLIYSKKISLGSNLPVDVLEIGPGERNFFNLRYVNSKFKVNLSLIDAVPNAISSSIPKSLNSEIYQGVVPKDLKQFQDKSFDIVICSHVIEHLKKEEGYLLMYELDRITKYVSVISTPNGFVWQTPLDKNGKNDSFNAHLSGWSPKELKKCGYLEQFGEVGPKLIFGPGAASKFNQSRLVKVILGIMYPIFQLSPNFCFAFTSIKRHKPNSNDYLR